MHRIDNTLMLINQKDWLIDIRDFRKLPEVTSNSRATKL